jgi:hypothetical protein
MPTSGIGNLDLEELATIAVMVSRDLALVRVIGFKVIKDF